MDQPMYHIISMVLQSSFYHKKHLLQSQYHHT